MYLVFLSIVYDKSGAAAPAQAATTCDPPKGSRCVHLWDTVHNTYRWIGPLYYCQVYAISRDEDVTWVDDNQYSGTVSTFYYADGSRVGAITAEYHGRPPGYPSAPIWSFRLC